MRRTVFTIGHSSHSEETFAGLLALHGITAVCDVRSNPYSRFHPQFRREALEQSLAVRGIAYRFLGRELGARSQDPACYRDGKVQYDRLARTELFRQGLDRVLKGIDEGFRIALMCAEKEPLECHRTILVARRLVERGVEVVHILADGALENHMETVDRLLRMLDLPEEDLFRSHEEVIEEAYRRIGERVAYERPAVETHIS
jgi:uncharacterized protein (DUF488 family)